MYRERVAGCLLVVLVLGVGWALLASPSTPPSAAQWSRPDLSIEKYIDPQDPDPFAPSLLSGDSRLADQTAPNELGIPEFRHRFKTEE